MAKSRTSFVRNEPKRRIYRLDSPHLCREGTESREVADWYGYVLHADHVTIKKGTEDELKKIRKETEVDANFTSFAINASFLFLSNRKTVSEQLKKIVEIGVSLFNFIY